MTNTIFLKKMDEAAINEKIFISLIDKHIMKFKKSTV